MSEDINVIEMASDIAEEWLQAEMSLMGEYPYVTAENGDVHYTETAQDRFNEIYDTVTGIIEEQIK
jgi:hypothetical protein